MLLLSLRKTAYSNADEHFVSFMTLSRCFSFNYNLIAAWPVSLPKFSRRRSLLSLLLIICIQYLCYFKFFLLLLSKYIAVYYIIITTNIVIYYSIIHGFSKVCLVSLYNLVLSVELYAALKHY